MSAKKTIAHSALMLTGVNLLLRFVGTSFQVYIGRTIGAAGLGLLQLVMSVSSLAMVAGMGGIRTATMYLTAEELGRNRNGNVIWILSSCLTYSILFSGTVGAVIYLFSPQIAEKWIGVPETAPALRLVATFLPVVCMSGMMTGYFTAAIRIGTLAAVEIAEQLCSMVVTVVMLNNWAGSDPVRACMCIILGSSLGSVMTLSCLVILRLREHCNRTDRISVRTRLLCTAIPLAAADDLKCGITTTENLTVPKRLALNTSVTDPLSAFGIVSGMVFPVIMFPAAILFGLAELLIPEFARCSAAGSKERIHYLLHKSLRLAALYGIVLAGLLFLLSERLCVALYKNNQAAGFMRMYALLIPMLYCDIITDAMTKGLGQQTVCVRYNILTSSMDLILLYFLLPIWGMEGYYFSFLVTHLINFLLSLRRLLKITGQKLRPTTPIYAAASFMLALLPCTLLINAGAAAVCYILMLGSLLYLFSILGRDDIRWICSLVRKKVSPAG